MSLRRYFDSAIWRWLFCNGDDLILNSLFNFEPMKGLEPWGDVRMFESASNSMCKSIFNMLKALNFSDG